MEIAYLGLGKMGKNMVLRLLEKGHHVVAWNRSPQPRAEVQKAGAQTFETVEETIAQIKGKKVIWLMLPAGEVTDHCLGQLLPLLNKGDIVIDGANSFYEDTQRRAEKLTAKGISFMDCGTSGGPGGAKNGACLMIGGLRADFEYLEPLFKDIAAEGAYEFFEGHGAGHFVKMVHNGIEYGMMQAIGEGFAVMKASHYGLDLERVAHIYQQQSVITSRLVGWTESGYQKYGTKLQAVTPTIAHTGEGQWTVETAQKLGVEVPIIEGSYQFRVQSENKPSYTGRVVSMLRGEFGGHSIK